MMLSEKVKELRKAQGMSQEELASRLHVVRQTVSKWEKGLSVPDADMLIRLADVFGVSVTQLLGGVAGTEPQTASAEELDAVARQLAEINEQLAVKNRRARRIWRTVCIVLGVIVAVQILLIVLALTFSAVHESGSGAEPVTVYEEVVQPEE